MEYDFRANWNPIYTLENLYPTQIQLVGGQENITFIRDAYSGIYFSGEESIAHFELNNSNPTILITGLSTVAGIKNDYGYMINCSGMITNNELVANIDNIVKIKTICQKYF